MVAATGWSLVRWESGVKTVGQKRATELTRYLAATGWLGLASFASDFLLVGELRMWSVTAKAGGIEALGGMHRGRRVGYIT